MNWQVILRGIAPLTEGNRKKEEFSSWRSYWNFARHVKENCRYIWNNETQDFLDSVKATQRRRKTKIQRGCVLWRAQTGVCKVLYENGATKEVHGFPEERMRPTPRFVGEGRANSKGIPVLYLASTEKTAVSEVRPWVGSEVSLAQFRVRQALKAVDLTKRYSPRWELLSAENYLDQDELDPQYTEDFIWSLIDSAFSKPVAIPEDVLDYIPTQILTELFRSLGYDAIIYRSQFGESGKNIAVFSLGDAEFVNCIPYRVSAIDVAYKAIDNPSYSRILRKSQDQDTDAINV